MATLVWSLLCIGKTSNRKRGAEGKGGAFSVVFPYGTWLECKTLSVQRQWLIVPWCRWSISHFSQVLYVCLMDIFSKGYFYLSLCVIFLDYSGISYLFCFPDFILAQWWKWLHFLHGNLRWAYIEMHLLN